MGNELAVRSEMNLDELQRTARMLVASGYFDAKGTPDIQIAQLATKIMAGRELGYGPFASVQGIHVIQGKPQISANLMAAAVKSHPRYDYKVRKMEPDEVVIEFFENGESIGKSSFTKEEATKAGTQNMNKFPRNMLFARALSNGVRWFCPDVFYGQSVYVEGELEETGDDTPAVVVVDRATGEIIEGEYNDVTPAKSAPVSLDAFVDECRTLHTDSNNACSDKQYNYLSGLIDAITGEAVTHNDIFRAMTRRETNSENRIGSDLARSLFDWIVQEKKGAVNPLFDANKVEANKTLAQAVKEEKEQLEPA